MKILLFSLTLLATSSMFLFCKHVQYTAGNLPAKQLHWGNGGGITGKETSYTLLENGQIFIRDGVDANLKELKATKAKTGLALINTAETLGLSKLDFIHPGNTYSFLEVPNGNSFKRISWGDNKVKPDPKIQDLYNQLTKLVSDKK